MKGPGRYDTQYEVWSEIVSRLSLVSRMALRDVLRSEREGDIVEWMLHREAERHGITTVEQGVSALEDMIAAAEAHSTDSPRESGELGIEDPKETKAD